MKELLEKYPKAAKVVKSYYLEKLLKSLDDKNLPDEFKEHVRQQGLQGNIIEEVLETSPRNLLDVFDENSILISVEFLWLSSEEKWFIWNINTCDGKTQANKYKYNSRMNAEKSAISEAFSILETKL